MTWTRDLPTTPGLYAWCDGRGGAVKHMAIYIAHDDSVLFASDIAAMMRGGLWQPLTIELPAPYEPPQPPKVEVYSATYKLHDHDKRRFLTKVADHFIATMVNGNSSGFGEWSGRDDYYTDIQRVEDK